MHAAPCTAAACSPIALPCDPELHCPDIVCGLLSSPGRASAPSWCAAPAAGTCGSTMCWWMARRCPVSPHLASCSWGGRVHAQCGWLCKRRKAGGLHDAHIATAAGCPPPPGAAPRLLHSRSNVSSCRSKPRTQNASAPQVPSLTLRCTSSTTPSSCWPTATAPTSTWWVPGWPPSCDPLLHGAAERCLT